MFYFFRFIYFSSANTPLRKYTPNNHESFVVGYLEIESDQKVSVPLMILLQSSGAQRLFDHPVFTCKMFNLLLSSIDISVDFIVYYCG